MSGVLSLRQFDYQEVIDPEWEKIVENHRRDRNGSWRGRGGGRETRSTIWDYKQPPVRPEPEASSARTEPRPPGEGVFSFVPVTDSAPQASSPEVTRVDSRQSRPRVRTEEPRGERRSRLSAFQQIWPQTYNSFQNRAVSVM